MSELYSIRPAPNILVLEEASSRPTPEIRSNVHGEQSLVRRRRTHLEADM